MTIDDKKKAPKEAVLLIGAGYGALKVAKDLAYSGLPVVWATQARHFLELPPDQQNCVDLPPDLDFHFRPLYLRVTRHPLVTPLTRAGLESLKNTSRGYEATVRQAPQFIDYNLCTGCRRCQDICPLNDCETPPISRTPDYCPSRALELDKRNISVCRQNCPLGVNVQAYMALTSAGRFDEALAVIREDNPLPGICGRVCHHPCESACRWGEIGQPVAIRSIKRFLYDVEAKAQKASLPGPEKKIGRKTAIVGSGPAGLAAAYFLNREGCDVTLFEALPEAGGMLRAGINAFRLPRGVLDAEIEALKEAGVDLRVNTPVTSLDDLFIQGFEAVLLSCGTHRDLRLNIPGEELPGVRHCVEFLSGLNLYHNAQVGPRAVIIGGGNSAMDAARSALRLGAKKVTVLAIEQEHQMPAHPSEIREAREEGIEFRLGAAPTAFLGDDAVGRVVCRPAHWEPAEAGSPNLVFDSDEAFELEADTVIVAIGQAPQLEKLGLADQVKLGRGGRVEVDDTYQTSKPGVFAAGDVVTGPSTVVSSMAAGRMAAGKIVETLTGEAPYWVSRFKETRGVGDYPTISEDIPMQNRQESAQRQPKARSRDFDEVDLGLTAEQAMVEAKRCLQCGVCSECRACETACAEIGAIDHFRQEKMIQFKASAVIVANRDEWPKEVEQPSDLVFMMPEYKGECDLMSIMMAGTSAAGAAMRRAADLRKNIKPRKKAVFKPPVEDRVGFFLCSCNHTMAEQSALDRILESTALIPEVKHREQILSVCHPVGSERIATAVRKHGLSRVVLASCLCCPLDFHCISCNDQRSRARIQLFEQAGLDRSRFEMVNLRDHLNLDLTANEAADKALSLVRPALLRARFMGSLRRGVTEIGNRIIILGGSEVGVSCAINLVVQGFDVRLVNLCRQPGENLPPEITERLAPSDLDDRITWVDEAAIEGIEGHFGNFTVKAKVDGIRKRWKGDMICLTDRNIVSLALPAGQASLRKFYRYDFAFFHSPQGGIYRVMPITLNRVSQFEAGAALAAEVATAMAEAVLIDNQLSPVVDPERCRGCGRCAEICPFKAVTLKPNEDGSFTAEVLPYNCVGCGGCVGRCPVTAMDMPFFSNRILQEIVSGVLTGDQRG